MIDDTAFAVAMASLRVKWSREIACAVSGGPDSMALLWLLSRWSQNSNVTICAFTVDHGLRPESTDEASRVAQWVKNWPNVTHRVLSWRGDKPETRLLERARAARYALLGDAMADRGIDQLLVAHHQDDQAETFLNRLAKGSGLDGLAGIAPVQKYDVITLIRPLLGFAKGDLVMTCNMYDVPYVIDPTNENSAFLRPRLRAAADALAAEGLSAKRLATTAQRLSRARQALEILSTELFDVALIRHDEKGFLFNYNSLRDAPEELLLRVLMKSVFELRPDEDYAPRLERIEALSSRMAQAGFTRATLGGCLFAIDRKNATLLVGRE